MAQNIIDKLYSRLPQMTTTDQKIAQVVLDDPAAAVNWTIAALATKASVSEASVSRFCKSLGLDGFHQLKILLAQVASDTANYEQDVDLDHLQQSVQHIRDNKIAEITNSLGNLDTTLLTQTLKALKQARLIQVVAEGNTYPVASDAIYKFNQIGLLAIGSESWATAMAQTLNLTAVDVLLVISNSGESRELLSQIKTAHQQRVTVIAITNRPDSPIAQQADIHLTTSVRQRVFQAEYYFSRIAAGTVIEALFLLLIADDQARLAAIKRHEALIANTKI
ncbi:MurR/RpiR family transcriptional regulator [Lactiplantibacillus daowaiensis]|uniref:MurR/RpiR family transcriptional regulator n=1 Tax=Lactiplantibacillus daowaiensis TaxID=2559918 RepID=A0ABW1S2H2_9LACO|nr:MurR/RpiR family transcriptional regulator [Lactiplantibacillus daowaiensis]